MCEETGVLERKELLISMIADWSDPKLSRALDRVEAELGAVCECNGGW
jgi:hypothetical protein